MCTRRVFLKENRAYLLDKYAVYSFTVLLRFKKVLDFSYLACLPWALSPSIFATNILLLQKLRCFLREEGPFFPCGKNSP